MKSAWTQWTLRAAVLAGLGVSIPAFLHADDAIDRSAAAAPSTQPTQPTQPTGSPDQLKFQAFQALRHGQFAEVNKLLSEASLADNSNPKLKQMADWSSAFETELDGFTAERRKAYDKAAADVQLLLKNDKQTYALDLAARAYLLSDDKKAFHDQPWVTALINTNIKLAELDETNARWLRAMAIYSDLGQVEPSKPEWKDKLKVVTRRVRLLAVYTPDMIKTLRDKEIKERDVVDALLRPATQPTTGPTTAPADPQASMDVMKQGGQGVPKSPSTKPADFADTDAFKIDWKESVRDIRMSMLRDSLDRAAENYYRDINYKILANGGIKALRVVATTAGLETVFPNLGDSDKKADFLKTLDDCNDQITQATPETEQLITNKILTKLVIANRDSLQLPEEVLVSEFADGAFAELDPFSTVIWPSDVAEFKKATQGEFSGVGIQIESADDGSLKVVSPIEDSPAYKAGIKADDIITHINGKNAKGITTSQAVKSITGEPGTTVMLTVKSPDLTVKEYTLRRETIKVASLKGYERMPGGAWDYFVDHDQKIAYMRLTSFSKTTGDELDKAVDELKAKGARAIILDLRYNPGGLLTAATDVSDKFLHSGVIVSTRADRDTPNPPTVATAHADGGETDLPLVVLVNQYSASASEIVSGALKDQHRATIVGERTFGKGSVQMLFMLNNSKETVLKLTTSHYYLPSGKCIHREENSTEWGVDPDITVTMTPEQMRAAIDARQDLDVLRDANAVVVKAGTGTTQPVKKDLLAADPQLSAGLLMLRLKLNGAS